MSSPLALVVDAVIALTLLEGLVLVAWWRWGGGGGVAPRDFLRNLVSGFCLMLALRCAVREAGNAPVLFCLLAAGLAHAGDLRARWRQAVRRDTTTGTSS